MDNANTPEYDLLVIGGGINGAGIAADAAGRGLSVILVEMNDLASGTSSASTKLIHGGLRYLEHYEFSLVRESLAEREVLMGMAPHIVWPLRFRLPYQKGLRPRWMIRSGLFLYDMLSRRNTLPASRSVRIGTSDPLREGYTNGFEFSDCWVDDARLVVVNALLAQQHGADVLTRTRCRSLQSDGSGWAARLVSDPGGAEREVRARAVVNATGPWAVDTDALRADSEPSGVMRLVKGCHIVVPRLFEQECAWMLQHEDKRVVFVIPYEHDFSLVGTTEKVYEGDPAQASISDDEVDYLLGIVNRYFSGSVSRQDIVHDFAGVRPLLEDAGESASRLSRDYSLALYRLPAPMLSVYGGKITTYRRLAEKALLKLSSVFPDMSGPWTSTTTLPGGDFENQQALMASAVETWPWLPPDILRRWVRTYGSRLHLIMAGADDMDDMGMHFGAGLYEREVHYLYQHEWATTADDILWRRTKLGLRLESQQVVALEDHLGSQESLEVP